jgi:hypothetical protein
MKAFVMSPPNRNPAPRGDRPQPLISENVCEIMKLGCQAKGEPTIRVRPQEITHWAIVWYFLLAIYCPYLCSFGLHLVFIRETDTLT